MFKSNMICCFIIWLFIVICQATITNLEQFVITSLVIGTVILTSTSVLVMAEEFQQLPESLQRISSTLVHNRNRRTAFICGVIVIMSIASSISLVNLKSNNVLTETNTASPVSFAYLMRDSENSPNQSIVLNLSLNATINNNYTINISNTSNCSEDCIKSILGNIGLNEIIEDAENITRLTSATSEAIKSLSQKLSNISQLVEKNTIVIRKRNTILLRRKRSTATTTTEAPTGTENNVTTSNTDSGTIILRNCRHPEYIVFTWVLCLIALATALKLYYLIKLFLAVVMVIVYTVLILLPYNNSFNNLHSEVDG